MFDLLLLSLHHNSLFKSRMMTLRVFHILIPNLQVFLAMFVKAVFFGVAICLIGFVNLLAKCCLIQLPLCVLVQSMLRSLPFSMIQQVSLVSLTVLFKGQGLCYAFSRGHYGLGVYACGYSCSSHSCSYHDSFSAHACWLRVDFGSPSPCINLHYSSSICGVCCPSAFFSACVSLFGCSSLCSSSDAVWGCTFSLFIYDPFFWTQLLSDIFYFAGPHGSFHRADQVSASDFLRSEWVAM